jgi:hypothetical protein
VKTAPARMPMMPPTTQRVTASSVNWRRMFFLVAPMALRMPISRVRSVTETSMMFMTPTPPTMSPTDETATMKRKRPPVS